MRYLKLKTQDPIYLPILDKLIQEAESSSETERLILYNLSRSLPQDLSDNQYKIIINEIVNYYEIIGGGGIIQKKKKINSSLGLLNKLC